MISELLGWYDTNARAMAWRTGPAQRAAGVVPDPYRVWLSEIMLQQTTVATVAGYFPRFLARWPSLKALAAANDGDVMAQWAGLGYYARARNMLKCARIIVQDHDGRFPDTCAGLLTLPGIGPYTAAAISAIAYDARETVVDGNVERVMARMFAVTVPMPAAKPALLAHAKSLTPERRAGDYAQAVMDLGATVCKPKAPVCSACPWVDHCKAHALGIAAELPRKTPKAARPTRDGTVYIARREDGALLLERRPDRGLLGGMLGWPGSDWSIHETGFPPLAADWQTTDTPVRHTFTHFHLRLSMKVATVGMGVRPVAGTFVPKDQFRSRDLPTVMRKAYEAAREYF